jgi:hypothetical protein
MLEDEQSSLAKFLPSQTSPSCQLNTENYLSSPKNKTKPTLSKYALKQSSFIA